MTEQTVQQTTDQATADTNTTADCNCQPADSGCNGCGTTGKYIFNLCCPGDYSINMKEGDCDGTGGDGTQTPGDGTQTPGDGTQTPGDGTQTPGDTPCDPSQYPALYYGNQLRRAGFSEEFTEVIQDSQGRLIVLGRQFEKADDNSSYDAVLYRFSADFSSATQLTFPDLKELNSIVELEGKLYVTGRTAETYPYGVLQVLDDQLELLSKHTVHKKSTAKVNELTLAHAGGGKLYLSTEGGFARLTADLTIEQVRQIGIHGHKIIASGGYIYMITIGTGSQIARVNEDLLTVERPVIHHFNANNIAIAPDGACWLVGDGVIRVAPDFNSSEGKAMTSPYGGEVRFSSVVFNCAGDALLGGLVGSSSIPDHQAHIMQFGSDLSLKAGWKLLGSTQLTAGLRTPEGSNIWVGQQQYMESGRLLNDNFALNPASSFAEPMRPELYEEPRELSVQRVNTTATTDTTLTIEPLEREILIRRAEIDTRWMVR